MSYFKLFKLAVKFEAQAVSDLEKIAQFFHNYDYTDLPSGPGASVYRDMSDGKVKSVDEWRKKRRARRKKYIKELLEQKHK